MEPLSRIAFPGLLAARASEVLEVLRIPEPLQQLLGDVQLALHSVKDMGKDAIEGVEVGLALHQTGAGQVVEAQEARAVESLLQGFHQRHPFLDPDRNTGVAQLVEEIEEHAAFGRVPTDCSGDPAPASYSEGCRLCSRKSRALRCPARS